MSDDLDQHATAKLLLDELQGDGHRISLTPLDLLDYMGILGIRFVRDEGKESAYVEAVRARATEPE